MQDDETKDAELTGNRPGKCFRATFLGLFCARKFTIYLKVLGGTCIIDLICFLVYHIQTLRS